MSEKYKILSSFIKDMSSETPNVESYLFTKDNISKYELDIDISSKPLKNKLIEVNTCLKFHDKTKQEKKSYKVGRFPFLANSRAKVNNEAEGFVKILADSKTDKVLGVHIIGPHCGDMIAEMALAMEFGASSEDIARTCHAHPTHTEAIKEAALAVDKRPIHF